MPLGTPESVEVLDALLRVFEARTATYRKPPRCTIVIENSVALERDDGQFVPRPGASVIYVLRGKAASLVLAEVVVTLQSWAEDVIAGSDGHMAFAGDPRIAERNRLRVLALCRRRVSEMEEELVRSRAKLAELERAEPVCILAEPLCSNCEQPSRLHVAGCCMPGLSG